jgi:hypothetical protein
LASCSYATGLEFTCDELWVYPVLKEENMSEIQNELAKYIPTILEETKKDETQLQQIQDTWLDASLVVHQIKQIQQIYKDIMKIGVHYGPAFPGSDKPSLLQPGAELLNLIFRIDDQPKITIKELGNGHREYTLELTAYNLVTGQRLGSGVGSCSTMESKYRYRQAQLTCPQCGVEAIRKNTKSDNGRWYCWAKLGGCGKTFSANESTITEQKRGRIENPDIADMYNTVLKIAKKRAYIDMTKSVTAASAFFTQDAEDFIEAKFENIETYVIKDEPSTTKKGPVKKENSVGSVRDNRPITSQSPPPGNGNGQKPDGYSKPKMKQLAEERGALQEFLDHQGEEPYLYKMWTRSEQEWEATKIDSEDELPGG